MGLLFEHTIDDLDIDQITFPWQNWPRVNYSVTFCWTIGLSLTKRCRLDKYVVSFAVDITHDRNLSLVLFCL